MSTTITNMSNNNKEGEKSFAILVVRHGERLDYVQRDAGSNWLRLPTSSRPFDPPLTPHGHDQGRRLGRYVQEHLLPAYGLNPITAIYSSPMIRCCETAAEIILGMEEIVLSSSKEGGNGNFSDSIGRRNPCQIGAHYPISTTNDIPISNNATNNDTLHWMVKVEPGLVESLNEDWYRSWCFPNSDGTWGGIKSEANNDSTVDPRATKLAATLLSSPSNIVDYMMNDSHVNISDVASESIQGEMQSNVTDEYSNTPDKCGTGITTISQSKPSSFSSSKLAHLIDTNYTKDNIMYDMERKPYSWNKFETRTEQQDRMEQIVQSLSQRHANETVVIVSHGGPVTHLFERLTHQHWSKHGMSKYTCFSLYVPREGGKIPHDGDYKGDDNDDCNERVSSTSWNALLVNQSCHLDEK